MILSNAEIQLALDEGRLVLDPQPLPRGGGRDGVCPYQTSAVDLRLGDEISYLKDRLPMDINLARGAFMDLFDSNSVRQKLTAEQPFVLRPGRLVLARRSEEHTSE